MINFIFCIICLFSFSSISYAESESDLLRLYGYDVPEDTDYQALQEIQSMQDRITLMQDMNRQIAERQAILDQHAENEERKLNTIITSIEKIQSEFSTNSDVLNNLIYSPKDNSEQLIEAYKNQCRLYESYAKEQEKLSEIDSIPESMIIYDTTDDVNKLTDLLETRTLEFHTYYEIGDVTNIKWIMPNKRRVNSPFGLRADPIRKDGSIGRHGGVDYWGTTGTEVGALFDGIVSRVYYSEASGNCVQVYVTDNVSYIYRHLSAVAVEEGDAVHQYETIAYVGGTGTRCTGPHLHLDLLINNTYVNADILFQNMESNNGIDN